jgi:hypothetical protein
LPLLQAQRIEAQDHLRATAEARIVPLADENAKAQGVALIRAALGECKSCVSSKSQ